MKDTGVSARIATWNIGGGFISGDGRASFDCEDIGYFAAALGALNCDIVCLQEVHLPIDPSTCESSQAEQLRAALGMTDCAAFPCDTEGPSHLRPDRSLGLAVLSRGRLLNARFKRLSNPELTKTWPSGSTWRSHHKGILDATTTIEGGQAVRIVASHNVPFHLFDRDFLDPAFKTIRDELEEFVLAGRGPTVLAGDLNFENVGQLLPRLFDLGFREALGDKGTEPVSGRRLDHIIVSPDCDVRDWGVSSGRADHFLCYADVTFAPNTPGGRL